jgi:hypothetical protein
MTEPKYSWSPLLGVAPVSTYEALEKLALSGDNCHLHEMAGSPRSQRWSICHYGDGLVHNLLALHHTKWWQCGNVLVPVEAISECGILALLKHDPGWPVSYDAGPYVPDEPLTCLRCLSGVDTEGLQFRQAQKENRFASAYGMSPERMTKMVNTNQPNMQQMPRKR